MKLNRSEPVLRRIALALSAGAALMSLQARGADDAKTQAEGIIFERQQVMMQLGKDADALGKIAAGQLPPDRLAATTKAIADGARDSLEAFKQQVPGGHAKPEVWSNYADFTARMDISTRSRLTRRRAAAKRQSASRSSRQSRSSE